MIRNSFYAAIGHLTGLLNDLYNISESRKGKGRRVQKEIPSHPPQVSILLFEEYEASLTNLEL